MGHSPTHCLMRNHTEIHEITHSRRITWNHSESFCHCLMPNHFESQHVCVCMSALPRPLTVSREGIWKIWTIWNLDRFILMVQQFHDGMQAHVFDEGESSALFPVISGVKQGCVLAPTLFSMMFSAILTDAFHDSGPDIDIRYRTDGDASRPRPSSTLTGFDFESSCSLMTVHWMLKTKQTCSAVWICSPPPATVLDSPSTQRSPFKQIKVMYQPMPGKLYQEPTVKVTNQKLTAVDKFTYLESTLSRSVHIDDNTSTWIAKA